MMLSLDCLGQSFYSMAIIIIIIIQAWAQLNLACVSPQAAGPLPENAPNNAESQRPARGERQRVGDDGKDNNRFNGKKV